jgi:xylan 1,4-beta-xylosidase
VAGTIDWQTKTRAASPYSYGLNVVQGFGLNKPQSYWNNMATMQPGIIRFHRWDMIQDSSSNPNGWVVSPTTADCHWDAAKIDKALTGAYAFGPAVLVNIPAWPASMDDGAGRLRADRFRAFAKFCADLVRIININQHRHVRYWEVTNELDSTYANDMATLGRMTEMCARAMKAADPTIKVGGPAFARPDITSRVDDYLSSCYRSLDFVSYHTYSSGNKTDSDAAIWDAAQKLGGTTTRIKAILAKYTNRPVETFHDEFNISWNPPDDRMANGAGAVYDALAMLSVVRAGATGSMSWNECDGWYGKMDNSYVMRPAAFVYQTFNKDMISDYVETASSAPSSVDIQGCRQGDLCRVALVNRSGTPQVVRLKMTNLPFSTSSSTRCAVDEVNDAGLTHSSATCGQLLAGWTLPADTVAIIFLQART